MEWHILMPDHHKGYEHTYELSKDRGYGCSSGPHSEACHQKKIPCYIEQTSDGHGYKGCAGISQAPEYASDQVIGYDHQGPRAAYPDVFRSKVEGLFRGMHDC